MKAFLLYIFLFCNFVISDAQTFSGSGGPIPDNNTQVNFPINVVGVSPAIMNASYGIDSIKLNITHPYVGDLHISVQSPNGNIIDLAISIGGDGDNFVNTWLNDGAATSILSATAPFTSTFRPQGNLGNLNNGQVANGQWKLLITDVGPSDVGNLNDWSIVFAANPSAPFVFTSSDLPIVVINTNNIAIPDEPKLDANMGIIYNGIGIRNNMTDPFNAYNNRIAIERRGSSSGGFPQKSYSVETRNINNLNNDTVLLGMPPDNDWVLYAPYNDKTCMRNVLSYDLARKMGHYAPRTRFCELVLNGNYQGIYVLMEKIKRDKSRVDISKLLWADTLNDQLTGGYIIKVDKQTGGGGTGWNSNFKSNTGKDIFLQYHYPEDVNIHDKQAEYIQQYVDSFEVALNGSNFTDPTTGFRKYADENSFIDYLILEEISKNVDGYRLSAFLFKDRNSKYGKLRMGPAWDFNLAWWNADYCEGDISTGWAYQFNSVCGSDGFQVPFWWEKMMSDPTFQMNLKCRWLEHRNSYLATNKLHAYIDSVAIVLDESKSRHFNAWPILGVYTWPNPSPLPSDFSGEITALKSWVTDRMAWLDANYPNIICTKPVVTLPNQISENASNQNRELKTYPNPFHDSFTMLLQIEKNSEMYIELYDILGQQVLKTDVKKYNSGNHEIEIEVDDAELKPGVYLLMVHLNDRKIIKKVSLY